MAGRVQGKIALITGAAQGLGEAIARMLVREGARVVLTDLNAAKVEAVAASLGADKAVAFAQDVTDEAGWIATIDKAASAFGGIHILVNNAGISGGTTVTETPFDVWKKVHAVDLDSVFLGCKYAIPAMAKTVKETGSGGSIVNISSIMGFIGGPDSHPGYSASKGAVRIFTKSAAVRFGPSKVRVNSVHPGYLPPMLNNTNAGGRAAKAAMTPLRRLGEVMDVAYGVLYLASDEASFVTGTELVIDGGFIAQ